MKTSALTAAVLAMAAMNVAMQTDRTSGAVMDVRTDQGAEIARAESATSPDIEQAGSRITAEVETDEAAATKQPGTDANRWRYRRHGGYWWYWTDEGRWLVWTGTAWTPYRKFVATFQSQEPETSYGDTWGSGGWYPYGYSWSGRGGGGSFGWERSYGYHNLSGYGWRWDQTEAARGR